MSHKRYSVRRAASRPRACDYDYDPTAGASMEVWDHEARWTGLLDGDGNEIWCDPIAIGFHHPLGGDQ